ncbi:hypothetical protein ACFSFY_14290 [Sporosarcina siberiensis]|uniref:Uncharacterized protein n=1 Tax=Sporosarcina siberiensis TaxID=1365606 RepID=A0ABW4SI47_9BACL
MNDNLKIELPEEGPEHYQVHNVLHSSNSDGPSVLILIHDLSAVAEGYIVRVYSSRQENDEEIFDHDLAAFALPTYESAVSFANRLPKLTAIELLMMQREHDFESTHWSPILLN